ncbi:MAG: fibronectin type III domain-containing protein [Planctomycetes bacterium]|nr:fibronectin type III domain-containing protein [Planctomycetota bacterium]
MSSKNKNLTAMVLVLLIAGVVGWLMVPDNLSADSSKTKLHGEEDDLKGTTPAQWRVIWHENPATEATIAWSTADNAISTLHLDTKPRAAKTKKYATKLNASSAKFSTDEEDIYNHYVELKKLKPATKYWFALKTGDSTSQEFWFQTAPAKDVGFKFLYGGDSRSNRDSRREVNNLIKKLVKADPEIICLVHGGDYISDGEDWEDWTEWLTDHELLTLGDGRLLPVVPARGNHEAEGPLYDEIWNTPGKKDQNYWVTALSPQFRIINLNTNIPHGGDQKIFLTNELKAGQKFRWLTANYHRPAYPAVKKPGDALKHWVPLFEKYNADVVFESDGHTFKRTVPIRAGKKAEDGIVYIGEGGLGVSQRTPDEDRWYFKEGGKVGSFHHVQKVTVTDKKLTVETIDLKRKVKDTWSRKPRKR